MARLARAKVVEAIEKYRGNISAVARAFGVTRTAIYKFCKQTHPELWETIEEQREIWLDNAESELFRQAMEDGNTTALIFLLKTQGYRRGYVERREVSGADGGPLTIRLRWDDDDDQAG